MYLRLLQIRDIADVNGYVGLVARAERQRGRLEAARDSGSNVAQDRAGRAARAAIRLAGLDENAPGREAAERGYADVIRLVMDHAGEIPFIESQIKYFHSQLFRHDPEATHRRQYRREGMEPDGAAWGLPAAPPADTVPQEMARLVSWTREVLESEQLHPLLAIATFLYRFLWLRPFADGNARLALALAAYLLDLYGYDHLRGVPVEEIFAERREALVEALRTASAEEREDATPWVHFFVDTVCAAQERAIEQPDPEPPPRLSPRHSRLLDVMRERKAAKIGDLLPLVDTPRATLKKDLRALVDAGHITTEGVRKGTVYYLK